MKTENMPCLPVWIAIIGVHCNGNDMGNIFYDYIMSQYLNLSTLAAVQPCECKKKVIIL